MTLATRLVLIPAVFAGWVLTAGPASARGIRDDAGFFGPDALAKADRVIQEIKDRYHKDLVIETVKTIPEGEKGRFESLGKNAFFQEWARARAKAEKVQGIYILICQEPAHLQVEVGNETAQRAFTVRDRDRLVDTVLLPKFKQKLYDQGLLDGVEFVRRMLAENLRNTTAAPAPGHRPNAVQGPAWVGWVCPILIVLLVVWLVIGLIRTFSGGMGGGYGGGGGGFMTGLLGGLFGAMAGSWLYHNFFGSGGSSAWGSGGDYSSGQDTDYSGSGGDFGDGGGGGGGDFGGGGGDFGGGGGDFGGGGGGGGDF